MKCKTISLFYFVIGFLLCSALTGSWGEAKADCIVMPEALKALLVYPVQHISSLKNILPAVS